jgi:hypothetical protein
MELVGIAILFMLVGALIFWLVACEKCKKTKCPLQDKSGGGPGEERVIVLKSGGGPGEEDPKK